VRGPVRVTVVPADTGRHEGALRVAYAVGKRCGKAATRNRIRRRLRAAVRDVSAGVPPGAYLVSGAPEVASLPYQDLVALVGQAMRAASGRADRRLASGAQSDDSEGTVRAGGSGEPAEPHPPAGHKGGVRDGARAASTDDHATTGGAPAVAGEPAVVRTAVGTAGTRLGLGGRLVLVLVHAYQASAARRPSPCRFWPSCSAYAAEAVELHGAWRGAWLAVRRLLRCRPLGPHGVDLVPLPTPPRGAR